MTTLSKHDKTRALFLKLARDEFQTYGYAEASTNRIVDASKMARGSLYYHFKDKRDLFRAVYHMVMDDLAIELQTAYNSEKEVDLKLIALAKRYFQICADPIKARITMIESLAVLDAETRHKITSQTIRPVLSHAIQSIMDMGGFKGHNRDMMTMMLFSALTESGRIISTLPNRQEAEFQFFDTFQWMLGKIL